jgi:hypothetical protein
MPRQSAITGTLLGCALLATLGLGACEGPSVAAREPAGVLAAPADSGDPSDAALLSAADSFESLVEHAYSSRLSGLEARIAIARRAGDKAAAQLPAPTRTLLQAQMARIEGARATEDRTEAALAAVEAYGLLIGAVRHPGKAPAGVGMLDYAGMRYDASRRPDPPRWDEMSAAVAMARAQWLEVSPQVKDRALLGRMDQAIADMDAAAARRDDALAARAARTELDLVDGLQAYFNKV